MTHTQIAILKTVIYADLFDYPLTLEEINRYLIADRSSPGVGASTSPGVDILFRNQKIQSLQDYYFLPGKQKLVKLRQTRQKISQSKLMRAQHIANKLAHAPSIQGIFLTGALAMQNAKKADDIDFLIVTSPSTLWSTRLLVNLLTDLLGWRRRPGQQEPQVSDKICLNLWLDDTALALPKSKRNLYTAHEVAQVKPLVNKNHVFERFLTKNFWITKFLPNVKIPTNSISLHTSSFTSPERSRRILHTSILEPLAYKLQYAYMKRKMSRESVSPHSAYFHPKNTDNQVLNQYKHQLLMQGTSYRLTNN